MRQSYTTTEIYIERTQTFKRVLMLTDKNLSLEMMNCDTYMDQVFANTY
jgi:hypothetical protein